MNQLEHEKPVEDIKALYDTHTYEYLNGNARNEAD